MLLSLHHLVSLTAILVQLQSSMVTAAAISERSTYTLPANMRLCNGDTQSGINREILDTYLAFGQPVRSPSAIQVLGCADLIWNARSAQTGVRQCSEVNQAQTTDVLVAALNLLADETNNLFTGRFGFSITRFRTAFIGFSDIDGTPSDGRIGINAWPCGWAALALIADCGGLGRRPMMAGKHYWTPDANPNKEFLNVEGA